MSLYADGVHRFSPSEISTFHDCRRKWMLSYFLSLKRKERDVRYPLTSGNLGHGALEVFYLNGGIHGEKSQELALDWLRDKRAEDLAECAEEHTATIMKAHKTAESCVLSYLHWVDQTGVDLDLEIIGTEDKLSMPGPIPNTELNGRIDLLARDRRTGDVVVLDFKFVSSITDKIRMLHLDLQAKTYGILARNKYKCPVRVAFRIIKLNQRGTTVKGPQEEEYTIHLNDAQLDTYWTQLGGVMFDIVHLSNKLTEGKLSHQILAYPSPSDSCSWKCPFFAVCPMLDDPMSDGEWLLNDAFESKFAKPKRDHESDPSGTLDTDATTTQEVTS